MVIKFYNNTSPKLALDKTLTNETTLNGTLREQTSLIDPVFNIESNNVFSSNYCYIPDFDRYYYVTGVESVRQGLWRVSLHVDVRMSFKNDIRKNTAIIERASGYYNLYLPDPMLPLQQDRFVTTYGLGGSFHNNGIYLLASDSEAYVAHSGGGGGHEF